MSEYSGEDRRAPVDRRAQEEPGWHLDKKVPLSLIFAMLVQAGMVIWAIADIKKDVELLKAQISAQIIRDALQDTNMRDAQTLLREQFTAMNMKLDRLIERPAR